MPHLAYRNIDDPRPRGWICREKVRCGDPSCYCSSGRTHDPYYYLDVRVFDLERGTWCRRKLYVEARRFGATRRAIRRAKTLVRRQHEAMRATQGGRLRPPGGGRGRDLGRPGSTASRMRASPNPCSCTGPILRPSTLRSRAWRSSGGSGITKPPPSRSSDCATSHWARTTSSPRSFKPSRSTLRGEICGVLRVVFGDYKAPMGL